MKSKIITILALVSLFVAGDAWGISGRLGEFGVGDSIDVPYYAYNCSGSKRAATCDSVTYSIYKDTLGHYAMPVDSGKVTATTAPSFAVSAGRGFVNYFLRICANAGNHAPGRYTAWIEAWDDTCSQMHNVWWDCYADSTTHEYAKNNRLIAGAVKAKTDNLPTDPADQSLIMDEVGNLDGASMLTATATAHAAYETLYVHKGDFHSSGDTIQRNASVLVASDNIGINWADVSNKTANVELSATTVSGVNTVGVTNALGANSIGLAAFQGTVARMIADSVHFADTTQYSGSDTTMGQMAINAATSAQDSMNNAIHADNKPNFKATGFATSSEGDSVIAAISDVNKANFKATGFAVKGDPMTFQSDSLKTLMGDVDSVVQAVSDANKANFKADVDSVNNAVADANKANFKATGFATDSDGDSVIAAITDINKANFKATGFATTTIADSMNNAIADANKANFIATGFATSADGDSVTQAISDINKANFKYSGGADSVRAYLARGDSTKLAVLSDSVLTAITDVNKANFKYGGGADSVRAHLATHDSTLLEIAAACGSGTGARTVTITVLNIADSTTAISGFEVDVYDSSSGEFKGNGTTNSNGVIVFSLDDETYTVHIKKTPWTLTSPRRFVITANMDSTFYATAFDPGSPPSASKCRVWTLVSDLTSNWLAGCRLSIWASGRYHDITFDGTTVSPYTVTGVSNDTGYVYIDVYRSAELTAGNGETVKMYIELRAPNSELIVRSLKEIPDAATYEIVW